jgi:3-oxoacyl-[acyl-carrier-protein] synthase-3
VPEHVRKNNDPIFGYLHSHGGSPLFTGYKERRVLGPGEVVEDLMVEASERALDKSGRTTGDIDLVVGYASVGRWEAPNPLVHAVKRLGIGPTVPILPINNEFAIFPTSLDLATAFVETGRAQNVLVCVGTNWTRYVDYKTQPAISAADGAGAAVVATSDNAKAFSVADYMVNYYAEYLGGMYMSADEVTPPQKPPTFLSPTFHLNDLGVEGFKNAGANGPVDLVRKIVAHNGLELSDITFIGHQASQVLNDHWKTSLGLSNQQFISTIEQYANMTSASIAVNLDRYLADITTDYVVLMALGPEVAVHVLLLARNQAGS